MNDAGMVSECFAIHWREQFGFADTGGGNNTGLVYSLEEWIG